MTPSTSDPRRLIFPKPLDDLDSFIKPWNSWRKRLGLHSVLTKRRRWTASGMPHCDRILKPINPLVRWRVLRFLHSKKRAWTAQSLSSIYLLWRLHLTLTLHLILLSRRGMFLSWYLLLCYKRICRRTAVESQMNRLVSCVLPHSCCGPSALCPG